VDDESKNLNGWLGCCQRLVPIFCSMIRFFVCKHRGVTYICRPSFWPFRSAHPWSFSQKNV
jgi:hypothetical protein